MSRLDLSGMLTSMYPVLLEWGDLRLLAWNQLAFLGIAVALVIWLRELRRLAVSDLRILGVFAGGLASTFLGAYLAHSWTVGREAVSGFIWSGYVLYGGVAGVLAYGALVSRFQALGSKVSFLEQSSVGALALAWAVFFARVGCALYGCCHGSPSGSWPGIPLSEEHWDLENRPFPEELRGVPLHPAPLYEALGVLAIALGVSALRRRRLAGRSRWPVGIEVTAPLVAYGVLRFWIELIRADPRGMLTLGLTPSQWAALASIAIGVPAIASATLQRGKTRSR